jgi:hypothetical protein
MRLPRLDVIFGLAALAIDIIAECAGIALLEIGDDETRVRALRAGLDAGDDALDPAPTGGAVLEMLEAARLALRSLAAES